MPCFNAEPYLAETLASLQAQGEFDWELLVVNDRSTDNSMKIVREACPEAIIVEGEKRGIGAALNLALPQAKGEYLAFIDADDVWHPDKLRTQFEALRQTPEWDGCFVQTEQFLHQPQQGQRAPEATGRHRGALLIKKNAFNRVGTFREDIKIGEFVDWCARAEQAGIRLGELPHKHYRRRLHQTNTMKASDTDKRDYLRVLKAHLDRKRSR